MEPQTSHLTNPVLPQYVCFFIWSDRVTNAIIVFVFVLHFVSPCQSWCGASIKSKESVLKPQCRVLAQNHSHQTLLGGSRSSPQDTDTDEQHEGIRATGIWRIHRVGDSTIVASADAYRQPVARPIDDS